MTYSPPVKLLETIAGALTRLASVSCGGSAPPPAVASGQPYAVISENADPSGTLALSVSVSSPATQANLKTIAESVIGKRKSEFRRITVKLYSRDAGASNQVTLRVWTHAADGLTEFDFDLAENIDRLVEPNKESARP